MRRILVEAARRKARVIHGGERRRIELTDHPAATPPDHLLALDDALNKLTERDPTKSEVAKLKFFAGLTLPQIASTLGLSLATVERHWAFARTWLYSELNDEKNPPVG